MAVGRIWTNQKKKFVIYWNESNLVAFCEQYLLTCSCAGYVIVFALLEWINFQCLKRSYMDCLVAVTACLLMAHKIVNYDWVAPKASHCRHKQQHNYWLSACTTEQNSRVQDRVISQVVVGISRTQYAVKRCMFACRSCMVLSGHTKHTKNCRPLLLWLPYKNHTR